MKTLRRQWSNGKVSLQTPVIQLVSADGRQARLVLTAHLGDAQYFAGLAELLAAPAPVFFEAVRSVDESPEHWRDAHHRFLRELREVYAALAALDLLAFQGEALAPREEWINADVTCCELAAKLREERVMPRRQELALRSLKHFIARAAAGDERAARAILVALQWGLLATSVTAVFNLLSWLPVNRRLYRVLNDWRSANAVRAVLAADVPDFTLLYGAAHGESILRGLQRTGYREAGREWHTVFTL